MKKNLMTLALGAVLAGGAILASTVVAGEPHKAGTTTGAAQVGHAAPAFTLTDTDGKTVNLADFKGKTVVLEWFNPGCPYVVKHYKSGTMAGLYNEFKSKDVVWFAINSGAPGKEGAGLETNKKMKGEWKIEYPILLDETGATGKAYGAKTTPHMFVINAEGTLVYAGAIDDNASGDKSSPTNYVRNALNQVLNGETVTEPTTKPYGCSVKYAG